MTFLDIYDMYLMNFGMNSQCVAKFSQYLVKKSSWHMFIFYRFTFSNDLEKYPWCSLQSCPPCDRKIRPDSITKVTPDQKPSDIGKHLRAPTSSRHWQQELNSFPCRRAEIQTFIKRKIFDEGLSCMLQRALG